MEVSETKNTSRYGCGKPRKLGTWALAKERCSQYLKALVPNTMKGIVSRARNLNHWALTLWASALLCSTLLQTRLHYTTPHLSHLSGACTIIFGHLDLQGWPQLSFKIPQQGDHQTLKEVRFGDLSSVLVPSFVHQCGQRGSRGGSPRSSAALAGSCAPRVGLPRL